MGFVGLEINKIYNEDCIIGMQRIKNESIDCIITDPPYGIAKKKPLVGKSKGKITTLSSEWDIFESMEDFQEFTKKWLTECKRVLKPTGSIAVWGDRRNIFLVQPILEELFPKFLDLITWIKRDAPPNVSQRGLAASTEFCLVYCKSEKGWTFNGKDLKKYNNGKQARNYLDIQRSMTKKERLPHPTQKKIETQMFLVEMMSNENEVILDPFVGSGTLPEAALRLNRNFIGFEIDKNYYNGALQRIKEASNDYNNKKIEKANNL
jgi:DNA modification methylase